MSSADLILPAADWWQGPQAKALLSALNGEARFVGGAVRDGLLGRTVNDVDLATPLLPAEVTRRLEAAGFKVIPTGIDHGTVTAVVRGQTFEITTLRRDVSTDGRRATVAFSTDWAEDAQRRDFTINGLFADGEGRVFDFTGGTQDLSPTRIRFIGRAEDRIREDYLRLMRFFRFHAHYGTGPMDAKALTAAAALAPGLAQLSAERVWSELKRLLAAPAPTEVLAAMGQTGVLTQVLPEALWPAALPAGDWSVRLLALLPPGCDLTALSDRLRWSKAELGLLIGMQEAAESEPPHPYGLLRRYGAAVLSGFAVRLARGGSVPQGWQEIAIGWQPRDFPLSGRDLIERGAQPGPDLGRRLAAIEQAWEAGGCVASRDELLAGLA
ncbi:CCA tRNA nucleotidyltransferase [Lacibacterium aquatile]|uniref:CCA tRNA nucleotidyltransferase n=1 Tax=Lacibacterium aquatile TaxID=1168082 RepID=A0ABW5DUR6_9PROT